MISSPRHHSRLRAGLRTRATGALAAVIVSAIAAAGCSTSNEVAEAEPSATSASAASTVPVVATSEALPDTTVAATTPAPATTVIPETLPATIEVVVATPPPTEAPTTVAPPTSVPPVVETRQIGTSVEGRPITAVRRGTPGGRVVLIIGVIHGDENAGLAIIDLLEQYEVPTGVDLWLVDSMNPDGVANNDRHNANQVDLNRNFPADWGPIGVPGDGQYAGPSVASEPETQAMIAFVTEIRPDLVMWYHQDLFRISPGKGRDGAIRQRYADLVGLPVVSITGGIYTGVAATWARRTIDPGVAFIVELGETLTPEEADRHARAVLTIAAEPN